MRGTNVGNLWMNKSMGEFYEVSNERAIHHGLYPLTIAQFKSLLFVGNVEAKGQYTQYTQQ
jgi:hypothetical protein